MKINEIIEQDNSDYIRKNKRPYECSDGDQGFRQWIDKEHHDNHCKVCKSKNNDHYKGDKPRTFTDENIEQLFKQVFKDLLALDNRVMKLETK